MAVLVPALYETAAGTRVPPLRNSNVEPVTVEGLISSLKIAETVVIVLTPAAPFTGKTEVTVGGVRSGPDG